MLSFYIIIICSITHSLHSAHTSIQQRITESYKKNKHSLITGMWTRDYLNHTFERILNPHNGEWPELTSNLYENDFWRFAQFASQDERDHLLAVALNSNCGDGQYLVRRLNIAAAVKLCKSNVPKIQITARGMDHKPLHTSLLYKDLSLTRLFLEHNANIEEKDLFQKNNMLYEATTIPLASLLIQHGALCYLSPKHRPKALHFVMKNRFEPAFIPFYKQHGYSAFDLDENKHTPLDCIAIYGKKEDSKEKATLLLEGYTRDERITLCAATFTFIRKQSYWQVNEALLSFICNEFGKECPICFNGFIEEKQITKTTCNHIFCNTCIQKITRCSLCYKKFQ